MKRGPWKPTSTYSNTVLKRGSVSECLLYLNSISHYRYLKKKKIEENYIIRKKNYLKNKHILKQHIWKKNYLKKNIWKIAFDKNTYLAKIVMINNKISFVASKKNITTL